ncbi:MAG: c-type cytochrome [Candidatus Cyclobacteriaceae bacterium M3_2C_046]
MQKNIFYDFAVFKNMKIFSMMFPLAAFSLVLVIFADPELTESIQRGEKIYSNTCNTCHMADGKGVPGLYPPLAGSDYLLRDPENAIRIIKDGLSGAVTVNGETYYGVMPMQFLSDQEIMDVMNYVLNSWGNQGGSFSLEQVQEIH